jgi:hypothetical protein
MFTSIRCLLASFDRGKIDEHELAALLHAYERADELFA